MAFGSLHFDGVAYLEGIDVLGEDASTGKFGVCVGAVDFDYEGYGAGCFVSGYGGVTPLLMSPITILKPQRNMLTDRQTQPRVGRLQRKHKQSRIVTQNRFRNQWKRTEFIGVQSWFSFPEEEKDGAEDDGDGCCGDGGCEVVGLIGGGHVFLIRVCCVVWS